MKVLLIDGSSMLSTDYYGSAPFKKPYESDKEYFAKILHTTIDGETVYTNAVSVMLKTILTLIKIWNPDKICVALDESRSSTFRREKYPLYKGNRGNTPMPLRQQKNTIYEILNKINITTYMHPYYEADDILYTISKEYKNADDIYIVTKDHDYWQIASQENVTIWMPQLSYDKATELYNKFQLIDDRMGKPTCIKKMVPYKTNEIYIESGVFPEMIAEWKGITGDKSDNIPGIKNVNLAAAPLLMHYGSIDNIYNAIDSDEKAFEKTCKEVLNIKRSPLKAFKSDKANAYLSAELATMVDVPLELINYNTEDLNVNINRPELLKIIKKYNINSLNNYL